MPESAITRLTDMIHAALVDETEPWPVPPLAVAQESLWQLRDFPDLRDLLAGLG